MANPFVYDREVSGETFFNRQIEFEELSKNIENSTNILIYSPRRYGKTSLIKEVLRHAEGKGLITCYCNLYPVTSEEDFLSLFTNSIGRAIKEPLRKGIEILKSIFVSISPVFTVDDEGKPVFKLDMDSRQRLSNILDDALEAIPAYAARKKRKAVVVFDEFQQISILPSDRLEKTLRTHIQTHKNVSYVFLGSKKHLLYGIFSNPNRPFYRSVKHFPLDRMNTEDYYQFMKKQFKRAEIEIEDKDIYKIISAAENHPYYVQYLAHEIWDIALEKKRAEAGMVATAVESVLLKESPSFQNIWDMCSNNQRRALVAIGKMQENDLPFSNMFLSRHNVGPASSFRKVIKSLEEMDIIAKIGQGYQVQDLFFKKWLQQMESRT